MNILFVDDDEDLRLIATAALTRYGGDTVREADGVAPALAALRAERPDLVITDLRMPGGDGTALLAGVRGDPALAGVPVVVLTAADAAPTADGLRAAGARAVLTKPFDPRSFVDEVHRLMSAP